MALRDTFFYAAGIGFLVLAKAKNILHGYSSPKPFDMSATERCIEYDIHVVNQWLAHLREYTRGSGSVSGMNILELGPGSDLGIGLYLLALGCSRYNACDVNDLVRSAPDRFYDRLFERLAAMGTRTDVEFLREQLDRAKTGVPSRLNYRVRDDFDIVSAFGESSMDLVFSQAAFEHFDDVASSISQLGVVCKPGAVMVAQIDLQTHSRWIRDKDPNNIYKYPDWVYDAFRFRGSPNRVRPFQYKDMLERSGWTDVTVVPIVELEPRDKPYFGMHRAFSGPENQMEYLSIVVCARRPENG